MTPRDLDPAVWVAAYGAAWADFYRIAYTATDAPSEPERRSRALETTAAFTDRMTVIADAAVLALHPEPTVQVMGERVPRGSATDLRAQASKHERAGDFAGEGALLDRANALDRLAALETAERAYLLAAGWVEHEGDRWSNSSHHGRLVRATAMGRQRHSDAVPMAVPIA
jgi:hypothetical protein